MLPLGKLKMKHLRSYRIYWHEDEAIIKQNLSVPVELLPREALEDIVIELDRRLIQLWDKTIYERQQKENTNNEYL